jgi:glycosyltransferase involved in cell wall biosynthesis
LERIAIVSEDISRPVDEGFKKATVRLAEAVGALVKGTEVFARNPEGAALDSKALPGNKLLWGGSFAERLKDFDPDVILYIPEAAATPMSLLRARALKRQSRGKPLILLSLQRRTYPGPLRPFLKAIGPDLVLVLSSVALEEMRALGLKAGRVPLGVDAEVFKPPGPEARRELRAKYGLPEGRFILHVGHVSPGRNLGILDRISDEATRVLVVSSTTTKPHPEVEAMLRSSKIILMNTYIERIEEIYRLVDGYIFPTFSTTDAIDIPLSVLEAMATNLPVASTAFGGLPDLFKPGEGLFLCDSEVELVRSAREMLETGTVATRDKVLDLSWRAAAESILDAVRTELA